MTFNATLGGDNSPTDKMNVKGDTQGNTRVRVDNIGGVGAQTVNGIELIDRADKTCFQIDLSSLKDKTDNILLCG